MLIKMLKNFKLYQIKLKQKPQEKYINLFLEVY